MADAAQNDAKTAERIEQLAAAARKKLTSEISKREKLVRNLRGDLEKHGDPERWKHYGDLILANVNTAIRRGDKIIVIDYFDEAAPEIEIDGNAHKPLTETAEDYFRRYTKARNGKRVIDQRLSTTRSAIDAAYAKLRDIDAAVEAGDETFLATFLEPERKPIAIFRKNKHKIEFKGARRFISSDGFEILVGKKATDNDFLTFRVARSLDLWMHAADYPGSHVVIRNPNRKEVPNRTLLEAAQLAAFYSSGRKQTKAAVNYTLKKFVNKPRRAAPGLVSLASFKTILVEPCVPLKA
jgi:predicted ribosome quality control (RQC) complex YloA/Tae2 family protein